MKMLEARTMLLEAWLKLSEAGMKLLEAVMKLLEARMKLLEAGNMLSQGELMKRLEIHCKRIFFPDHTNIYKESFTH